MSSDFSSIDRLVEFGMGLSLAQQMVNTMNHAMNNMQVAGINAGSTMNPNAPCPPRESAWYVVVDNRQAGPLTPYELEQLIAKGAVGENTLVWRAGMTGWQLACEIPEVNKLIILKQ